MVLIPLLITEEIRCDVSLVLELGVLLLSAARFLIFLLLLLLDSVQANPRDLNRIL